LGQWALGFTIVASCNNASYIIIIYIPPTIVFEIVNFFLNFGALGLQFMLAICVWLLDSLVFNCNCVFLKPQLDAVWHLLIVHINYFFGFQSWIIVHHVWVVFVVVIKLMHYGLSNYTCYHPLFLSSNSIVCCWLPMYHC
jgi:hypothetical protein